MKMTSSVDLNKTLFLLRITYIFSSSTKNSKTFRYSTFKIIWLDQIVNYGRIHLTSQPVIYSSILGSKAGNVSPVRVLRFFWNVFIVEFKFLTFHDDESHGPVARFSVVFEFFFLTKIAPFCDFQEPSKRSLTEQVWIIPEASRRLSCPSFAIHCS